MVIGYWLSGDEKESNNKNCLVTRDNVEYDHGYRSSRSDNDVDNYLPPEVFLGMLLFWPPLLGESLQKRILFGSNGSAHIDS